LFYEEEVEKEIVETESEANEREKNTHRLRREFLKREKTRHDIEDKFERKKNKKPKSGMNSKYDY
jgi:hypothetical protein